MAKKAALFLSGISLAFLGFAQVKVGEWKDHLSYNSCNTVAKAGSLVYASNKTGLLKFNPDDNSAERLNKINGLSDIGISLLRYNPHNGVLLVIYDNANIDVIKDGNVTNFSDIKRKTITGKKNINEVTFKNNLAYLACGFGIVVFDTDKIEIKDTYYIGPGGNYVNVYQIAFTDTSIFAATASGLRRANLSTFLNNFQNWSTVAGIPYGTYNGVVSYNGKMVANYSPYAASNTPNADTLYSYNGNTWSKEMIKTFPYSIKRLIPGGNYFELIDQFGFEIYDPGQQRLAYVSQYSFGYANIADACADLSSTPTYWIADLNNGFIRSFGAYPYYANDKININGTHSNYVSAIDVFEGKALTAPVVVDETGVLQYSKEGMNFYDGSEWKYVKEFTYDTLFDLNRVLIDRKDPTHFWATSWAQGLAEYKDNKLVKVYNSVNSPIPHLQCCADWDRTSGLGMDKSGNLYVGCSNVPNYLTIRKTDGSFINVNFNAADPFVGRILVDKSNQIWVLFPRGQGASVIRHNNFTNFVEQPLNLNQGSGMLPSMYVYAIAEDQDDHIWIGTDMGVAVFYNPANISNGGNFDCQQIKIVQDGNVQYLLATEKVNAIAVDGANRKWCGTEASGVFCFSPDGQQQIYHFTKDSSPLFSDNVVDLAYDDVTGDVFVSTDQGLQSYRTYIVKGEDEYTGVHAYPNPVRPGYAGNVYVRGLVDQSVVKITDLSGNLVWETKSQGGQIEWPLKNLKGQRVASGVYMAYCATTDGGKSAVAKIMVLN